MMLIMLINLGSTAALEAVLFLSTVGLYLSYLMPISIFMVGRWRGTNPTDAPFCLGRWGTPTNLFALAFGIFMIIFLPLPSLLPVTWATMNYSGPYCLLSSFWHSWIGSQQARRGLLCPLRSMVLTEKARIDKVGNYDMGGIECLPYVEACLSEWIIQHDFFHSDSILHLL